MRDRHQGGLHLLEAVSAHPILAPVTHWSRIWDSEDLRAENQVWRSRNASTYGPDDGLGRRMGPRSKGMGWSKLMTVVAAEYSSRFCGCGGCGFGDSIFLFLLLRR